MIQLVALLSVYNSSSWLKRRLDNLFATDIYKRNELLIYATNAASQDEHDAEILRTYVGRSGFVTDVIEECSCYATWNHIIKSSDSCFLTNTNSDDLISPTGFDILITACENADIAYCDWYTIGDGINSWADIVGAGGNASVFNPKINPSCGHFPLWRRSLHSEIGLFDPTMLALGDADFWHRCWLNKHQRFVFVNQPLAAYQWRSGCNLWHRTPEETRAKEWQTIGNRTAGRLDF